MMYEYEFRLLKYVENIETAISFIDSLSAPMSYEKYTVSYYNSYRIKKGVCEIKTVKQRFSVFFNNQWYSFVESVEKDRLGWTEREYKEFWQSMGLQSVIYEHRYEIVLSENAKIYAFQRGNGESGIVFEVEVAKSHRPIHPLPVNRSDLVTYGYLQLPGCYPAADLKVCYRKPVSHTDTLPDKCLKACKYDGVFGIVYAHSSGEIQEIWEDQQSRTLKGNFFGGCSFAFAAERVRVGDDEVVILLDVYYANGYPTYRGNVCHILCDFLPVLKSKVSCPYQVTSYVLKDAKVVPIGELPTDGVIYHTFDDYIYKVKDRKTVDLLFEDGYFYIGEDKMPYHPYSPSELRNGQVYEVIMEKGRVVSVVRERTDRFWGNTKKQIESACNNSSPQAVL